MSSSSEFKLGFNTYGKDRVRLVKVTRGDSSNPNKHFVEQLSVKVLLENFDPLDSKRENRLRNSEPVYIGGNNDIVVATDTCKNTVYCVAANNAFESIEDFGILLGKHFLKEYPLIVKNINIEILQDIWERLPGVDSAGRPAPHNHSFKRVGPQKNWTHVTVSQQQPLGRPSGIAAVTVRSGVKSLDIMKTAQSGFSNFHRDRYTSLAETDDRLLGTSLTAEWLYDSSAASAAAHYDFSAAREKVLAALLQAFTGPSDEGVFSPSVQQTLYQMGCAALSAVSEVQRVNLMMPNIHNIPFPLQTYGIANKDSTGAPFIFFPIDEPHGSIQAVVERGKAGTTEPRPLRAKL